MKLHASVAGDKDLMKALNALSEQVKKKHLIAGLREAAEPMRARMEDLATRGDEAPHLKDHIGISTVSRVDGVRIHEDAAAVAVGPTKGFFYGFFLEFGTVKMPPQPFVRPAFDAEQGTAMSRLRGFIWNRLKGSTRSGSFRGV